MLEKYSNQKYLLTLVSIGLVMCAALAVQFRVQLATGFDLLYGDSFDATIVSTILQHWYNFFRGVAPWDTLNYFYPHVKTLGQTDGYFLAGIIYTILKPLGFDPFATSELTNVVIRGIGFICFVLFSRKVFNISIGWAVFGAVLFVLSNNLTAHGQRLQLATVSFVPLMGLLLFWAYEAFYRSNKLRFTWLTCLAGIFLGAWTITCFYIAWFFLYFFVCFIVSCIFFVSRSHWASLLARAKYHAIGVAISAVVAVAALIPLLSVYLEKASETGMRPFAASFSNTVTLEGVLQVGTANYMFGDLYAKVISFISPAYSPSGEYYNTGIAPMLFFLFVVGSIYLFRHRKSDPRSELWSAVIVATLVSWLGVMRFGDVSAWYFVYYVFPGAKALNVINAYQLLLVVPIILVAIKYLDSHSKRIPVAIFGVLGFVLILEELNAGYIKLSRPSEVAKIQSVDQPAAICESFYVSGWLGQDTMTPMELWINNYYGHNVSAMLIAELLNMPTLNGIASFNPKDWNFGFPNNKDYDQRVYAYGAAHGLKNVCKLDLNTKKWSVGW